MNLCLLISPGIKVKHFQTKLYLFLGSQCWLPHPYCKEEEGGGGAVSRRQDHDTHRGRCGRPQHDPDQGPGLVQREHHRLQAEVYLLIYTIVGLSMRTSTPT